MQPIQKAKLLQTQSSTSKFPDPLEAKSSTLILQIFLGVVLVLEQDTNSPSSQAPFHKHPSIVPKSNKAEQKSSSYPLVRAQNLQSKFPIRKSGKGCVKYIYESLSKGWKVERLKVKLERPPSRAKSSEGNSSPTALSQILPTSAMSPRTQPQSKQ